MPQAFVVKNVTLRYIFNNEISQIYGIKFQINRVILKFYFDSILL